jgi:Tat protein secretion system quality control protein TatD with DNase activity
MPKKDDWDARFAPEAKRTRRRGDGRSQGLLLMLIAIGIPLVVFFLQVDGALRLSEQDKVFERTLTTAEHQEIRAAIDKHKAKLDTVQRIVEEIKETYRGETGASYERDVWVVHVKEGLAIPFKYVLAFGAILFLIGIGKLIL